MSSQADPARPVDPMIGGAFPRIDGALKVSGGASYTSDKSFPGMLYAVPVCATIASGEVTRIDTGAAAKMPGVQAVFTRESIGRFFDIGAAPGPHVDERRPPLDDDVVRYYGQYVALVVADSFEAADAAAAAVAVTYARKAPNAAATLPAEAAYTTDTSRGDADGIFAAAPGPLKIDATYTTPI